MIASGAVVVQDVPDYALMAGVPARQIGWVCECGTTLRVNMLCEECGRKYSMENEKLIEIEN